MSGQAYTVLTPVDYDRHYEPGETIEMPPETAAPLLDDGVVCDPDDPRAATAGADAAEAPDPARAEIFDAALDALRQAPAEEVRDFLDRIAGDETIRAKVESAFSRAAAIAGAIEGLDRADESKWTKSGKPTTEALEAVLGFSVTADERDAAYAAMEES